jgi:formylglycine-generating enzyme required for sulfatase activity
MAQVFISYAHESTKDQRFAQQLHQALERHGLEVWIDRLLHAGEDIAVIERELDAAACAIVVWSIAASRSKWVPLELARAAGKGKAVPVHIEPEANHQRPLAAEHLNFIDLHDWNGQSGHPGFKQVLRSVEFKVRAAEVSTKEEAQAPHPGAPKKPRSLTASHLSSIRTAARNPDLWRTSEFIRCVKSAPASIHDRVAQTILGEVRPDRSLNELAALHLANEHLQLPIDRRMFFAACGRWPPPTLPLSMRLVPDGTYSVGSPTAEPNRCDDEHQQAVRLTAFLLSATPITNAQFLTFSPAHPLREWDGLSRRELQDHPAVRVTWWEAYLYCAWLGGRLPSEAQWEAACRAGSETAYAYGHEIDRTHANFNCGTTQTLHRTVPVGSQSPANAFGLHDMHGNMWEWCLDTYDEDFFIQALDEDPVCKLPSAYRVARGGSWNDPAHALRSAFRNRLLPESRMDNIGFRLAFPAHR